MVHCPSRCRNSSKSSSCFSFSACAGSRGACLLFIEFSHPIHHTPEIRTFPSTIHDSHHSVDRTLANFLFRLTVDRNGQRHFAQMAWINKRPTTSITAQVTP